MRIRLAATAAAIALAAGAAVAADTPAAPAVQAAPKGYLAPGAIETLRILPPAPVEGTPRYEADRQVFLATRKLKGTPRWDLAIADDNSAGVLTAYSCAAGVVLDPKTSPALVAIALKVRFDSSRATNVPKDVFQRKRPYLIDEGDICIARTDSLAKSPDYPSGHATWGWTMGLILAEADPAHATDILARARAYGESRIVCGVHNMSAIEAARTNASALVAALHGSEAFRADVEAARKEIDGLHAWGARPDAAQCAAEKALTENSVL